MRPSAPRPGDTGVRSGQVPLTRLSRPVAVRWVCRVAGADPPSGTGPEEGPS